MQLFRISLTDGTRKFHTALHAPDATAAEVKAGYFFDTTKWQIVSVTRIGAVAA
jgi:hypothetical protein